tara:strand:+ start:82 stop:624 length:543 start_codon:yes stop_codon:yes gene_type:complete
MKNLKQLLKTYIRKNPHEINAMKMLNFFNNYDGCFEKDNLPGHFTGSAWVISPDKNKILMTHHKKLNMWLQLGGHADGETDLKSVALKEAKEESGLNYFSILSEEIFDLDIHQIEPMNEEPEHLHYDVRFLLEADPNEQNIIISEESYDVKWIQLDDVFNHNSEESISRMVEKTKKIKSK